MFKKCKSETENKEYVIKVYTVDMRCAIWYDFYNLKNVENTHGWVLLLGSLQLY